MTNREHVLHEAEKCVCHDRNDQYGSPEDNFQNIAYLWEDYIHAKVGKDVVLDLDGADVANMMILFKVARNVHNHKEDNWIDIAGYAACGAEIHEEAHDGVKKIVTFEG